MRTQTPHIATGVLLILSLGVVSLAGGGCASNSTTGEKMVQSYDKTREKLTDSQHRVYATLKLLERLRVTPAPGLTDTFADYKAAVAQLQKDATE